MTDATKPFDENSAADIIVPCMCEKGGGKKHGHLDEHTIVDWDGIDTSAMISNDIAMRAQPATESAKLRNELSNMKAKLGTVLKVLDYASDSSASRANQMNWAVNAINDIIAGKEITEPPRAF